MLPEQEELFREIILDHHKRPRHAQELSAATDSLASQNPETGDSATVWAVRRNEVLEEVACVVGGSAVLTASASLMCQLCRGKSVETVYRLCDSFLQMLSGPTASLDAFEELGDAIALSGIRRFPARVKCAALPWRTLRSLLDGGVRIA